ncbi:hypothetical protein ACFO9Q_13275 [Paenibacillus sp. GCM10023252]|uniref:hypothetical protein n=1 Tax=Paenibacillus sp. GCM10023252 TaxID=3252649 RepID=UPI0036234149
MPYTKLIFKSPSVEQPTGIHLSSNCGDSDVEQFLQELVGDDVRSEYHEYFIRAFDYMLREDEVVLAGGVAFFDDENKYILPSCCCGLEDWESVQDSIQDRVSPWLGHDPTPCITFQPNYLTVWSDSLDPQDEERYNIPFTYNEILASLDKNKTDFLAFIDQPLFEWISKRDEGIAELMKQKMRLWFIKD